MIAIPIYFIVILLIEFFLKNITISMVHLLLHRNSHRNYGLKHEKAHSNNSFSYPSRHSYS